MCENTQAALLIPVNRCRLDEMLKASASTSDAIRASPQESDAQHCAFNTGLGMPLFSYYAQNPKFAARFAKAMAGVTQGECPPIPPAAREGTRKERHLLIFFSTGS